MEPNKALERSRLLVTSPAYADLAPSNRLAQFGRSAKENMDSLDFHYQGGAAGAFEGDAYPKSEGHFPYEPYRSGSHYKMVTAIEQFGSAIIEFDDSGTRRQAKVNLPEYGILNIVSLEFTLDQK